MIGFNLLCDLQEVESIEHINQTIHINNKTLKIHVSYSDMLSLGPTDVLEIISINHSHAISMTTSRNPKVTLLGLPINIQRSNLLVLCQ